MTAVDRLIPSVADAHFNFVAAVAEMVWFARRCECRGGPRCEYCCWAHLQVENAALSLDMALAQASDLRRAEADRLRAEVAW